ncbi:hypothetical protein XAP412_320097 [Xanthomonas phaseoli pv. phaseoli]|uniref:Uncharacterized protein n=1 Tax=Xanthomonas campestris pv. phaseoli TaxID=317013 RepID=A0AB38E113_XANCH|nr:hypothetical protein XAP6984_380094 [Xanthomonas phaseoli pv. phaseoli]SON83865.1 hypothetical protein XAP412_320097 [Xanthomonas phaseoli pv. phaseoli]SON88298.1 hypothetical protein XAP7430_360097 [Xanthomonas phaseoli pv. phaseoli]SOO27463.1 hypothetical protein XAP6164_1620029 [Xanthomonas phaseoli pv. phaseoli]
MRWDNGHREVLPNLLRLAELRWFYRDQWLQIRVGVASALLAVWMLRCLVQTERLGATAYAAGLIGTLSVFWLGTNGHWRMQTLLPHVFVLPG